MNDRLDNTRPTTKIRANLPDEPKGIGIEISRPHIFSHKISSSQFCDDLCRGEKNTMSRLQTSHTSVFIMVFDEIQHNLTELVSSLPRVCDSFRNCSIGRSGGTRRFFEIAVLTGTRRNNSALCPFPVKKFNPTRKSLDAVTSLFDGPGDSIFRTSFGFCDSLLAQTIQRVSAPRRTKVSI
jgi:hypothetical protein